MNQFSQLVKKIKEKESLGKPVLILIQGIPGAGKTTLAKRLCKSLGIRFYEADQWFARSGTYKFEQEKLGVAHQWCYNKVKGNLMHNQTCICSNTLTASYFLEKYLDLASQCNANYFLIKLCTEHKSVHNPPSEIIQIMREQLNENPHIPDVTIYVDYSA